MLAFVVTYHKDSDTADAFLVGAFSTVDKARTAIIEDFNEMKETGQLVSETNTDLDFSHLPSRGEKVTLGVVPIVSVNFDGWKSYNCGQYNITQAELDWLIEPKDQPLI